MARLAFTFLIIGLSFGASGQTSEKINHEGHYAFTPLKGWNARISGTDSYVYAPADGAMDPWDEKLEFSITSGENIELDHAFNFYTTVDFPEVYAQFELINQGEEEINGLPAKWAVFTFSGQGTASAATASGDSTISANLQALFYVIKKGDSLYLVNGVTEKNLFARFDSSFRTIIRTFRVKE
ncbi:MAG: hypothetical protein JNJ75_02290 [Cyclobacteriaceae bacterium]|nr:hypothetical protein [Cyclobacteriaceae bacterium]